MAGCPFSCARKAWVCLRFGFVLLVVLGFGLFDERNLLQLAPQGLGRQIVDFAAIDLSGICLGLGIGRFGVHAEGERADERNLDRVAVHDEVLELAGDGVGCSIDDTAVDARVVSRTFEQLVLVDARKPLQDESTEPFPHPKSLSNDPSDHKVRSIGCRNT